MSEQAVKTFTDDELQIASWFSGQIAVIEQQTGRKVQRLLLDCNKVENEGNSVLLILAPIEVQPPLE